MKKRLALLLLLLAAWAAPARADTVTNRLGLTLPTVGGDYYTWGTILNNDLTLIDALAAALAQQNVFTSSASFQGPVYFGNLGQSTVTVNGQFQGDGSGLFNIPGSALQSGSTFYVQNTPNLQSGATAYPQFLSVGSTATIKGSGLSVNGLSYTWPGSVPGGNSALQNDGSGNLTWAPGSGTNILNQNMLQAGSTAYPQFLYVGSSATIVGAISASSLSGSGSALTSLNGSNVTSGTVGTSFLPASGIIFSTNTLQSGTTVFPSFLYVGSSATIPTAGITTIQNLTTETYSNGAPNFNGSNGRILQSVYCSVRVSSTTTSNAGVYDKSNVACTITPKLSTSLIRVNVGIQADESNGLNGKSLCDFQLERSSSTAIGPDFGDACGGGGAAASATNTFCTTPLFYLDSPATTSATVYGVYFSGEGSGGGCVVNSNNNRQGTSWMNLEELGQ